jgi:dihydrolipoamide dehydrogenase
MAVRIALGEDVRVDLRAVPRATYTEPETAGVGLQLDQARAHGLDAFEVTVDVATTAKGEILDTPGHVTIVVDRGTQQLVGANLVGPASAETLHEAVLAIRAQVPLPVLADTIHAFPTLAGVLGSAFVDALRH